MIITEITTYNNNW